MIFLVALVVFFARISLSDSCTCDKTTMSCSGIKDGISVSCFGCTGENSCTCSDNALSGFGLQCDITTSCSSGTNCRTYAYNNLFIGERTCVNGQCSPITCGGISSQSPFGTNCPGQLSYCDAGTCKTAATTPQTSATPIVSSQLVPATPTLGPYGCGNPTIDIICCDASFASCTTLNFQTSIDGQTPGAPAWIQPYYNYQMPSGYNAALAIGIGLNKTDGGTGVDFVCDAAPPAMLPNGYSQYCRDIYADPTDPTAQPSPFYGCASQTSGAYRYLKAVRIKNSGIIGTTKCAAPGTSTYGVCTQTFGPYNELFENVGFCNHNCGQSTWNSNPSGGCPNADQCNHDPAVSPTGTCLRSCSNVFDVPSGHSACKYALNATQIVNGVCQTDNTCDYVCNGIETNYPFGNSGCPSNGGTLPQICDGALGECVYPNTYTTLIPNATYTSSCDQTIGGVLLRSSYYDAVLGCVWVVGGIAAISPVNHPACPPNSFVDNGVCRYYTCNGSLPVESGSQSSSCLFSFNGYSSSGLCMAGGICKWQCNGNLALSANDPLLCGTNNVCDNAMSQTGQCKTSCGGVWGVEGYLHASCGGGICTNSNCYSKCNNVVGAIGTNHAGCNGTGNCDMLTVDANGNGQCKFTCNGVVSLSYGAPSTGCQPYGNPAAAVCACLGLDVCQCTCGGISASGTAVEASKDHVGCATTSYGHCDGAGKCWNQCGGTWSHGMLPNLACNNGRYLGKMESTCGYAEFPINCLATTDHAPPNTISTIWEPVYSPNYTPLCHNRIGECRSLYIGGSSLTATSRGSCMNGNCVIYEPYSVPPYNPRSITRTRTNRYQFAVPTWVEQQTAITNSVRYPTMPDGIQCVDNTTVYGTLVGTSTYYYSCKYFCNFEVSDSANYHPGCRGRGRCESGETVRNYGICHCYNFAGTSYALYGEDCSLPTSTTNCSSHGHAVSIMGEVLCQCDSGYTGWDCHRCDEGYYRNSNGICALAPICPYQIVYTPLGNNQFSAECPSTEVCVLACGEHSWCAKNNTNQISCQCENGFYMKDGICVELLMCGGKWQTDAGVCSGNGVCDFSGQCTCRYGYTGPNCDVAPCANVVCGEHGRCMVTHTGNAECVCNSGWAIGQNNTCTTPICDPECAYGNCIAPGECSCNASWTGATCEIPDCGPTCNLGYSKCSGSTGTPVCTCLDGFTGPECRNASCSTACNAPHKICRFKDSCECTEEYYEDVYGNCQPICSNCNDPHASCVSPGMCSCNPNYVISNGICVPVCATPCSATQTCSSPDTCTCKPGYTDIAGVCVSNCAQPCQANQVCVTYGTGSSQCVCQDGYLFENGVCVPHCSGCQANAHCTAPPNQCACDSGYQLQNGVCEPVCYSSNCLSATQALRETIAATQIDPDCLTNYTIQCDLQLTEYMCQDLAPDWGWNCSTVASCFWQWQDCIAAPEANPDACNAAIACNPAITPEYACLASTPPARFVQNACANKLHSQCTAPLVCNCAPGWGGEYCNVPNCVDLCVHSQSVWCNHTQGSITCAPCKHGWSGGTCDIPDCSMCPSHSSCDEPGRCYCDSGFYFNSLGLCVPMCANCSGIHSHCTSPGACECDNGFTQDGGGKCVKVCSPACGQLERCDAEQGCVCSWGYELVNGTCATKCPPLGCAPNQHCESEMVSGTLTAICECDNGFFELPSGACVAVCYPSCGKNEQCNESTCECVAGHSRVNGICEPICNSPDFDFTRATCVSPNVWTCNAGYVAPDCHERACPVECNNNQFCNTTSGSCECENGWIGAECTQAICSPVCQAHSDCVRPGVCVCSQGYYFEAHTAQCERIYYCNGIAAHYPNVCSGRGDCITTNVCQCEMGYSGTDCSSAMSCDGIAWNNQSVCSGHGFCVSQDVCSCRSGWLNGLCQTQDTALTQCQTQLGACDAERNLLNASLTSCQTSCGNGLLECQRDLTSNRSSLWTCNNNYTIQGIALASCQTNYGACQTSLGSCSTSLGTCNTNYGVCNTSLSTCVTSYGACTTNYGTCTTNLGTCTTNLGTCNTNYAACIANSTTLAKNLTACLNRTCPTCPTYPPCVNATTSLCNCSLIGSLNTSLAACQKLASNLNSSLYACQKNTTVITPGCVFCPPGRPFFYNGVCWKDRHEPCRHDKDDDDGDVDGELDDNGRCVFGCNGHKTVRGQKSKSCIVQIFNDLFWKEYHGICIGRGVCKYPSSEPGKNVWLNIEDLWKSISGVSNALSRRAIETGILSIDSSTPSLVAMTFIHHMHNVTACSNGTLLPFEQFHVGAYSKTLSMIIATLIIATISVIAVLYCYTISRKSAPPKRKGY
jgi:hypothetical protein